MFTPEQIKIIAIVSIASRSLVIFLWGIDVPVTLAEMRRNVRYALGLNEPEELPIIDQKINDGVRDVLRRTGCTVLCFDATTPDNENRVTLAPGIMRVMHVTRNGVRLDRVLLRGARAAGSRSPRSVTC